LLCALTYFGSSAIARWAVFVQKAEVIVHFRARVVLLEQQPVLCQCVAEIADALIVDGEAEVVGGRRRRRD